MKTYWNHFVKSYKAFLLKQNHNDKAYPVPFKELFIIFFIMISLFLLGAFIFNMFNNLYYLILSLNSISIMVWFIYLVKKSLDIRLKDQSEDLHIFAIIYDLIYYLWVLNTVQLVLFFVHLTQVLSATFLIFMVILNSILLVLSIVLSRFNRYKSRYLGNMIALSIWLSFISVFAFYLTFTSSISMQYIIVFGLMHSIALTMQGQVLLKKRTALIFSKIGILLSFTLFIIAALHDDINLLEAIAYEDKLGDIVFTYEDIDQYVYLYTDGERIYKDALTYDVYDQDFNLLESYSKEDSLYYFIHGEIYKVTKSADQLDTVNQLHTSRYDFHKRDGDTFIYQTSMILDDLWLELYYFSFFVIDEDFYYYNQANLSFFKVNSVTELGEYVNPSSMPDGIYYQSYNEILMIVDGDLEFKSHFHQSLRFKYHNGYIIHTTSEGATCKVLAQDYDGDHASCDGTKYMLTDSNNTPYPYTSRFIGTLYVIDDALFEYRSGSVLSSSSFRHLTYDIHADRNALDNVQDVLVLNNRVYIMRFIDQVDDARTYAYYTLDPFDFLTHKLNVQEPIVQSITFLAIMSFVIIPINIVKENHDKSPR